MLTQRFSPHERELAFRCEFRNRKRNKGESVSDYGYALPRLGQKAFPLMPSSALESCIIEQFVHGLGNFEMQIHVQFFHPQTLDQAISSAVEYCALLGFSLLIRSLVNTGTVHTSLLIVFYDAYIVGL